MENLVDCSKVTVKKSKIQGAGVGVYASCHISKGDIVERGIARVLTDIDGHINPYVFTWSDENPNKTWAIASGCATFYNTCNEENANTIMLRDFERCIWEIVAKKILNKETNFYMFIRARDGVIVSKKHCRIFKFKFKFKFKPFSSKEYVFLSAPVHVIDDL